jgi:hypothetical protein
VFIVKKKHNHPYEISPWKERVLWQSMSCICLQCYLDLRWIYATVQISCSLARSVYISTAIANKSKGRVLTVLN